ncbi:MAG: DNA polymerase III subunit chi [Gammaproteobacteria bacterium]|nr:DNA polymerase III subunit chi [Gammaproteobacteria bacterium]
MTRVDFYILEDVDLNAMMRFACRLAGRAVDAGKSVYLHTNHEQAATDIDDLLWAYPDQRFIPHGRNNDVLAVNAPVVIGWEDPREHDGVLINLSDQIPTFFGRFDRVAEIVVHETKSRGRERYQFYRDRGYPLFDHHLDDWETQ